MKIETETVNQLKFNSARLEKIDHKLKMVNLKMELEDMWEKLNQENAQLINGILLKEKKAFEDIEDINLEKGEITFKEVEDAESTRPDNKTVSD